VAEGGLRTLQGVYRFGDYVRLGLPLSLVMIAISMLVIPVVWPLR
jgi:di/tricarboxylate transporter